ncbi:MAG: hypothetical protein ACJ77K_10695 [Bacteroidia bacterium]
MKSTFFQVCAGLALVLFAAGFLIRSFSSAEAAPAKKISMMDSFAPVGISGGDAYYFSFDINGVGSLRKAPLTSAE